MKKHLISAGILSAWFLTACGEVTILSTDSVPKPPAATLEKVVSGAMELRDAPEIGYGVKYRIYMDAADPVKKKQYFRLRVDTGAPFEQRFKVVNLHPRVITFSGRCIPYARTTAEMYSPSRLKLGGAWEAKGEGATQENKVEVFSATELILEAAATAGAGYIEIDLEKYY